MRADMGAMMSRDLFDSYAKAFETRRETVMTIRSIWKGARRTR